MGTTNMLGRDISFFNRRLSSLQPAGHDMGATAPVDCTERFRGLERSLPTQHCSNKVTQ